MTTFKRILSANEAREKLLKGIDALADTVKVTLGPNGKTVLFKDTNGKLVATKDGVSVAKQIKDLECPFENYGALLARQAAEKTLSEVGDGTTTSTILAQAFIREGLKFDNIVELKKTWTGLKDTVVAELKKMSKPCKTKEELINVATISANNDRKLGELIAKAITKVGKDGVITVEESKDSYEDTFDQQEGLQLRCGYLSRYFVNQPNKAVCELTDCHILAIDESCENFKAIVPLLETIFKEDKSLLILCNSASEGFLNSLIPNVVEQNLKVCVVQTAGEGEVQKENLIDAASVVGADVISTSVGKLLKDVTIESLGKAKKVIVGHSTTTLIAPKKNNTKLKTRIEALKEANKKDKSEQLKRRLARLQGGIGTIKVGKATEIELKEKRDRIEDALFATTAALEDGIVPGGGQALDLSCRDGLGSNRNKETIHFALACTTAGRLLFDQGIKELHDTVIDPTKVVITALENALSLALTVLSIEAIIVDCEKGSDLLTLPDLQEAMKTLL